MEPQSARLVVLDARHKVIRNVEVPGGLLNGKADLLGDGIEQVVLSRIQSDDPRDDPQTQNGFLVDVRGQEPSVTSLGTIWTDPCAREAEAEATASVLYASTKDGRPVIRAQRFRASCEAQGKALPAGQVVGPFGPRGRWEMPDPRSARKPLNALEPRPVLPADDALPWKLLFDFRAPACAHRDDAPKDVERRIRAVVRAEVARAHGDQVFVFTGATGAFTAPKVRQAAFLVVAYTLGGPRGTHESWLVISDEHGNLSPPFRVPAICIEGAVDLDGDGIDELVTTNTDGTFTGMTTWDGMLVQFHGEHADSISLGEVGSDGCNADLAQQFETAAVVFVAVDQGTYRFREERYVGACYQDTLKRMPAGAFVPIAESPTFLDASDCTGKETCALVDPPGHDDRSDSGGRSQSDAPRVDP
jgi:hypothetical protein